MIPNTGAALPWNHTPVKFQFAGNPETCNSITPLDRKAEVVHIFALGRVRCLCGAVELVPHTLYELHEPHAA